jgi:HEAT repeat protein
VIRRVAGAAWVAGVLCAAAVTAHGEARASAAGRLLAGAAAAPLTVVGTVHGPVRVDLHGRAAELAVEEVVAGPAEAGARLRIAWEELGADPGARLRFAGGDRLLVALVPMPSLSLWKARFPEGGVWVVAERGGAVLRAPAPESGALLAPYLALAPDEREGPPGAAALGRLVVEAETDLAAQALEQLHGLPEAGWETAGWAASEALGRALADGSRPASIRSGVLALAGGRRIQALRAAVVALAQPGSALEAEALDALGRLDGALPPAQVRALLARRGEPVRAVAVRYAGGALDVPALGDLVRRDADPAVRAEAVLRLVARGSEAAVAAAAPGLFDPENQVKAAAVRGLAGLGAVAVPTLHALAERHGVPEVAAPVAALGMAGPEGRAALEALIETHPDERVRELARLALGQPLGHDRP